MATARRRRPPPSTAAKAAPDAAAPAEPVVLSGTPRHLRATVTVRNETDELLRLRAAAVSAPDLPGASTRLAGRVRAGTTRAVPVSVQLDAATAPGSYPAELDVGGLRREVVLRVEPDLDLRVSPRQVLARAGVQPIELRVRNEGNVAIGLARRVRARTRCDGVVSDLDVELTLDASLTVEPGVAVDARGELLVPALDPRRRHEARVPVGTADLHVVVLPSDDDPAAADPDPDDEEQP